MTLHQGKDKAMKDFFDKFTSDKIQVTNYSDSVVKSALYQALSMNLSGETWKKIFRPHIWRPLNWYIHILTLKR